MNRLALDGFKSLQATTDQPEHSTKEHKHMTNLHHDHGAPRSRRSGVLLMLAASLALIILFSGCASKQAQAIRNDFAVDLSADQKEDAVNQFHDDTKQLLWNIEYRLGSAAKVQRAAIADIEARYQSSLAAVETAADGAAVTNRYRDERAAQEARYRAAVESHIEWAVSDAATKYRAYNARMQRAQGILDADGAANIELATASGVIDGVLESSEFRELWALVVQKAAPWIDESGADVPPLPEPADDSNTDTEGVASK